MLTPLVNLGALPLTLIASLAVAVFILALRIAVLQRLASKRQRENRQQTERLRALIEAYRTLAGSFTPAQNSHAASIEEALASVVLFGSVDQVRLAVSAVTAAQAGQAVDHQALIESMRVDLRLQLGLQPIPADIVVPRSGPSRLPRGAKGQPGRAANAAAPGSEAAGGIGGA